MFVYIVTSLSQEEDNVGTILRVDTRVHGPFTELERANAIADKYGGTVAPFTVDQETNQVVQHWENPGYVQSS